MAMRDRKQFTVPVDAAGMRVDAWLASCSGHSRSRVQGLLAERAIWRKGDVGRIRPKERVSAGEDYMLQEPEPLAAVPQPQSIALDVCYEDADMLVVDKPAGLVVHPAAGHPDGTLVNALLHHCTDLQGIGGELRPGIVHRLDKDTSGLLVVAKHEQALHALVHQFQVREVRKVYLAIGVGVPDAGQGLIETEIGRSRHDRKRMSTQPASGGKRAVTRYTVLGTAEGLCLLGIRIETGRTHQIRVHLAHIGVPVLGDQVYGTRRNRVWRERWPGLRQMLHARALRVRHPVRGEDMHFIAAVPADMQKVLEAACLDEALGAEDAWLRDMVDHGVDGAVGV